MARRPIFPDTPLMPKIQASPALARLRILDLTRVRAGPTCVRQFADFGADVIKVETPGEEDLGGARDGSDFQNLHRNKRSMTLDLKAESGRDIFRRLVAISRAHGMPRSRRSVRTTPEKVQCLRCVTWISRIRRIL